METETETFRSCDLMSIVNRYMNDEDSAKVYRAFLCAANAHDGVSRKCGLPYITHPLEVGRILADLHMDADGICAALLHDVIEDTEYTKADIAAEFGDTVADLVDGVTKFEYEEFASKQDALIASFRKMMGHMTRDYRVVLIKLADRMHNLRTIGATKRASQIKKADETFNLYIPLARRMGMNKVRRELQELALKAKHPWRYHILRQSLERHRLQYQERHSRIVDTLKNNLAENGLGHSSLFIWQTNICRLYERMSRYVNQGKRYSEKDEVLDIRVLVTTTSECYQALGMVHKAYLPKPGKFNDYIAAPKFYGFQALQTMLVTPGQQLVTVQIQTQAMFQVSQYGIAAKWRYPNLLKDTGMTEQSLNSWLRQVGEIHDTNYDPMDFYQDIKADLFLSEIQLYTPDNHVVSLPHGSTAIDFAYALGADVGNYCEQAIVDGGTYSLKKPLPNGASVEIVVSSDGLPTLKPSWLKTVKTAKAKSAIRKWLNQRKDDEFIELGKKLFSSALSRYGLLLDDIDEQKLANLLTLLDLSSEEALWRSFGKGEQCVKLAARRLLEDKLLDSSREIEQANKPMLIQGAKGLAIYLQTCCHPVHGDRVTARFNAAYGLEVHRSDCPKMLRESSSDMEDELVVAWAESNGQMFLVPLNIRVKNELGLLSQITAVLAGLSINIESLSVLAREEEEKVLKFLVQVSNVQHMQKAIKSLGRLSGVLDVERPFS